MTLVTRRHLIAAAALSPLAARAGAQGSTTIGRIHRLDPGLDTIVDTASPIEVLGSGYRWAEGPAWSRAEGHLLFSDVPANIAYRWRPTDGVQPWLQPSGLAGAVPPGIREAGSNGLSFARDGALLIANSGGRSVDRLDPATRRRTRLATSHNGKRLNSPNDLVEARSGAVFFTDPPYGLAEGDDSPLKEQPHNGLYRIDPGGTVVLLDGTESRPNGLALSPDERTLYLALSEDAHPRVLAFDLSADGTVSNKRVFCDMRGLDGPGLPDGVKTDRAGHVFATGPGGVHVISPAGRRLGLISTGKATANIAFGEDGRSLFLTSSDMLARVRLRSRGW